MPTWWKRTSGYLSSHSNLFIIAGGIVGGAYLLSQYAISKFQQIQEKLLQDKNAKENLRRRFSQNQEDCIFTVLALLPTLGDQLFNKLNVEQLTESLRATPPAPSTPACPSEPDGVAQAETLGPSSSHSDRNSSQAVSGPNQDHQEKEVSFHFPPLPQPVASASLPSAELNSLAKSFVPSASLLESHQHKDKVHQPSALPSLAESVSNPPPSLTTHCIDSSITDHQRVSVTSPSDDLATSSNGIVTDATASKEDQQNAPIGNQALHLDARQQRNRILADRRAKLHLWNELKLISFARAVTSLYCVVLLTLQTHVQLNLIGRFAYLASVEAQARESDGQPDPFGLSNSSQSQQQAFNEGFGLDHEIERLYLTFSWWFLHEGWNRLSDRISIAIEKVLSPLSLKAQISMADLKTLLRGARTMIEHGPSEPPQNPDRRSNFLEVLFPVSIDYEIDVLSEAGAASKEQAESFLRSNKKLRALLDETKDIIESEDFNTVLRLCFDRVFEVFFNSLNPSFGIQPTAKLNATVPLDAPSAIDSRFQELSEEMQQGKRLRLASLFPLITRQSQLAIYGVPNEYIENLAESKELRALSAIIYAAWSRIP